MLPLVKFVQLVGSVVFDVAHAYCIVLNPEPPASLAVNVVFIVAFPVVGIIYVPPFGLIVTVGFVLSIFETCKLAVALFPAESVPSAYTVPFDVTVTVVAFAVLALPTPAFQMLDFLLFLLFLF